MNRLYRYFLAGLIEFRWALIMYYRKKGTHLIKQGEPLSSKRLIQLGKKIDHHGIIAFRLQDNYEALLMSLDKGDSFQTTDCLEDKHLLKGSK